MISTLNTSSEAFLANVDRIQRTIDDAGRQTSSGKRVNVASDAPAEIDTILQLRTSQARNRQIESNLGLVKTTADAADNALSTATKLMDRARVIAAHGAGYMVDTTGREALAHEVESLIDQMVAASRTAVQGRYVFGGDQDGVPPYAVDLTADNGVARLTQSTATRRVEDAAGGSFAVSKSAQDVFDLRNPDDSPAPGNVFAALNTLRTALLADDPARITASLGNLESAADHLNLSQSFYGAVQNRIADAVSYAENNDLQLKIELGQKEDADITAAALAVTQGNTQLQAAFAMQARMPHTTLFDFLG